MLRVRLRYLLSTIYLCANLILFSSSSFALQIYKGDNTPGGLVPDFPQIWDKDKQGKFQTKGICAAVAVADSLWYFDQHGYPGLVKHKDPTKPNDTWRDDAKDLIVDIAGRIYGKDPLTGKKTKKSRSIQGAIQDYLTERGLYNSQKKDGPGLTVQYLVNDKATYKKWEDEMKRSEDVIGHFVWRKSNASIVTKKDSKGKDRQIRHAMTGAGWDTDKKKIKVANPWGDHPGNEPPYKKSYFNEYDITIDENDQVRIPKKEGVDLFGYNADHITLDGFWDISPGEATKVRDSTKPGKTPGMTQYDYEVENMTFDPIFQFALEVQVPFSIDTIKSPDEWSFLLWDPSLTPDVFPLPPQLPEPEAPFCLSDWTPSISGIFWYTTISPIMPGSLLDGFSFEVSSKWPHSEFGIMSALSDGLSIYLDNSSTGLVTEYGSTSGPIVPEPSTLLLLTSGLVGVVALMKRGCKGVGRVRPRKLNSSMRAC